MNYPNGIKKSTSKVIDFSNRGMTLENMINTTNKFYIDNDIAYIYKKPIPIQVVDVDYPSRNKVVIKKAFYSTPSTTDYNGIYKGFYIDFEVKETKSKTSFSLANLHQHQFNHLKNISRHNGIGFIIIRFSSFNEVYLLEFEVLDNYISTNSVKSLPYKWVIKNGCRIKEKIYPQLDYLKAVDKLIEKRYENE